MNPLLQGVEQTALPGRLNPFYLEGRPLPLAAPIAQQLRLRDGQIIQATVEARAESLKLLLNGRLLDLPPNLPPGLRFRPGDTVWLRALQGAGGWTLKPVDPATAQPAATAALQAADEALPPGMSRLLALSLRPPTSPLLMQLFQPAQAAGLVQSAANPELGALLQGLQLSMRWLTPAALQAAVMSSGFWLEALLARGQSAPGGDTKSLLRRLIRSLGERDAGAVESLKRAIDDIESAQVESLAAQARGELSFSMVLPFRDGNPVSLRFFRPPRRPGQEAPPFSVDIHTINDVLGEIWLKTSVTRAAHVELMMWALKESVVRLARRHADGLGQRLSMAGLTMDSFRIFHAARPSLPDSWAPSGALLDVRA